MLIKDIDVMNICGSLSQTLIYLVYTGVYFLKSIACSTHIDFSEQSLLWWGIPFFRTRRTIVRSSRGEDLFDDEKGSEWVERFRFPRTIVRFSRVTRDEVENDRRVTNWFAEETYGQEKRTNFRRPVNVKEETPSTF